MHIAIIGLGPAGAVLAHRALSRGWTVDGYDPACVTGTAGPDEEGSDIQAPAWRSTYRRRALWTFRAGREPP